MFLKQIAWESSSIDENGDYDLKKQQDLAMKYATIETMKENICDQIYNLTNIVVN